MNLCHQQITMQSSMIKIQFSMGFQTLYPKAGILFDIEYLMLQCSKYLLILKKGDVFAPDEVMRCSGICFDNLLSNNRTKYQDPSCQLAVSVITPLSTHFLPDIILDGMSRIFTFYHLLLFSCHLE